MQTTDMATMLQILQSPMGAALIPTMQSRENVVMDQSRATLADTISRTGINQDENARKAQMHPLDMASRQAETQGRQILNDKGTFDASVREIRGGAAGAAFRAEDDEEFKRVQESGKQLATVAAQLQVPKGAVVAPGQLRTNAEAVLKANRLEHLIPTLPQDETQIAPAMAAMAEHVAKFSRQFITQEAAIAGRAADTAVRTKSAEEVARIRIKGMAEIARIKAEAAAAKASAGKAGGGGDKNVMKNSTIVAIYTDNATKALQKDPPDEEEAAMWTKRAEAAAAAIKYKKPAGGPTKTVTTIGRDANGNIVETKRTVPDNDDPETPVPGKAPVDGAGLVQGWGVPTIRQPGANAFKDSNGLSLNPNDRNMRNNIQLSPK